jgi:prevent-host-death family protein
MKTVSIAQAKNGLPELVHAVETGEPVQLARRGQPVAVLLSDVEYRRLKNAAASALDFARWAQQWRTQLGNGVDGISADEISRWRDL